MNCRTLSQNPHTRGKSHHQYTVTDSGHGFSPLFFLTASIRSDNQLSPLGVVMMWPFATDRTLRSSVWRTPLGSRSCELQIVTYHSSNSGQPISHHHSLGLGGSLSNLTLSIDLAVSFENNPWIADLNEQQIIFSVVVLRNVEYCCWVHFRSRC